MRSVASPLPLSIPPSVNLSQIQKEKRKGKVVNQGAYLVGTKAITQLELENMEKRLRRMGKKGNLKKIAVKLLIERAVVTTIAEEEAIIVSEEKIQKEIKKQRQKFGLSKKKFRAKIEREVGLPFGEWIEELRYRLTKTQLIQIILRVPPPSIVEMKEFYRKNRSRIGLEFRYREIILIPKNKSFKEEARISSIAKNIYQKLRSNPKGFAQEAKTNPNNRSYARAYGGLIAYKSIYDIASANPIMASILFRIRKGEVSRPFRDSRSRYIILKVENKRPLPFQKVRYLILQQIYSKKEAKFFDNWLAAKRKEFTVVALP